MNWGSAEAFFAMGGYGLYVWGSYIVTAVVIAGEVVALRTRARAARMHARNAQALAGKLP